MATGAALVDPDIAGIAGAAMSEPIPASSVAALLTVQVLFGMFPVVAKLAIAELGAGGVSIWRIVGAAAFFQAVRLGRGLPGPPPREWPTFFGLAILGIASNQLLFLYGLARTSATHAGLLVATIPVFTVFTAILSGRESMHPRRIAGIVVALAGAAVLITGRDASGTASLVGDLMVLANAAVYSVYLVLSRDLLARWPPLVAAASFFAFAIPVVLPFTGPPPLEASPGGWAALAFCVLGPTITTYFLNLVALRRVPSSVVAIFIYVQPFVAALLAWAWLGERIDGRTVLAGLVSFVGILLATR